MEDSCRPFRIPHPASRILALGSLLAVACVSVESVGVVGRDGRRIVDNGDGTWSFVREHGARSVDVEVRGAVTWRYLEQARYAWTPSEWGELVKVVEEPREPDPVAELLETRRYTASGEVWAVESVDEAQLQELVDAAAYEPDPPLAASAPGDPAPTVGDEIPWIPNGWSTPCGGADDLAVYDEEDRVQVTSPYTDRQQTFAVLFQEYTEGAGFTAKCSATRIGLRTFLTAAHCVMDADPWAPDTPIPELDLLVCMYGNLPGTTPGATCMTVLEAIPRPAFEVSWPATADFDDDVAVVTVVERYMGSSETMELANEDDISGFSVWNYGSPGVVPDTDLENHPCTPNSVPGAGGTNQGVRWYRQGVAVTDFTGDRANWKADGGVGHSGGPVFHCPGGTCESGEPGRIDAVWAGYLPWPTQRFTGPRTVTFRTWALNNILE